MTKSGRWTNPDTGRLVRSIIEAWERAPMRMALEPRTNLVTGSQAVPSCRHGTPLACG